MTETSLKQNSFKALMDSKKVQEVHFVGC